MVLLLLLSGTMGCMLLKRVFVPCASSWKAVCLPFEMGISLAVECGLFKGSEEVRWVGICEFF